MTKETAVRPPDTRKHTVLPVSIRLKSTEKTPACVSMRAFLQPISARIYFGKTASHRKRARLVQSRGASPQAYWMSVKAAQRRGCAKRAFCGVCFLMPGGLTGVLFLCTGRRGDVASPPTGDLPPPSVGRGPRAPPGSMHIARRDTWVPPYESYCAPFRCRASPTGGRRGGRFCPPYAITRKTPVSPLRCRRRCPGRSRPARRRARGGRRSCPSPAGGCPARRG